MITSIELKIIHKFKINLKYTRTIRLCFVYSMQPKNEKDKHNNRNQIDNLNYLPISFTIQVVELKSQKGKRKTRMIQEKRSSKELVKIDDDVQYNPKILRNWASSNL
jgi:hypothetical protein